MTTDQIAIRLCAYEATLAFILKRFGAGPESAVEILSMCEAAFPHSDQRSLMAVTVARMLSGENVLNANVWTTAQIDRTKKQLIGEG